MLLALYRSRWGLRVRATVSNRTMANAIGMKPNEEFYLMGRVPKAKA